MSSIHLILPWPPTVNHYWMHINNRKVLGKKGRVFRASVIDIISSLEESMFPLEGRIKMTIKAFVPDRRKRDLDNMLKAPLDAMEHAGVYVNDEQIDDLSITREGREPPGRLEVFIEEIG